MPVRPHHDIFAGDLTDYSNVEVGVSVDVFFNPELQLSTLVWSNVAAGAKLNSHLAELTQIWTGRSLSAASEHELRSGSRLTCVRDEVVERGLWNRLACAFALNNCLEYSTVRVFLWCMTCMTSGVFKSSWSL